VVLSLFAELISNDRPLLVRYKGSYYLPAVQDYPETTFGGDFETPPTYLDPFIRELLQDGNWAIFRPTRIRPKTLNYFAHRPIRRRPRGQLAGHR
jgi:microcin C transport system permease protein